VILRRMALSMGLIVVLLLTPAIAQDQFTDLVNLVERKDDAQAVKLAERLEESGHSSFGLYYNKGLALRNQGLYARARAAFEIALTYDPRDLTTRRRLSEVKERLGPQVVEIDITGTPLWKKTEAESALLFLSLIILAMGLSRLGGREVHRKSLFAAFASLFVLILIFYSTNPPQQRAVIISPQARLLAQPQSDSQGPVLQEGVMVGVLAEKSHFLQIEMGDGQSGWVRAAETVRI
jgi:tetratricopeptide (TPR) repeat protein